MLVIVALFREAAHFSQGNSLVSGFDADNSTNEPNVAQVGMSNLAEEGRQAFFDESIERESRSIVVRLLHRLITSAFPDSSECDVNPEQVTQESNKIVSKPEDSSLADDEESSADVEYISNQVYDVYRSWVDLPIVIRVITAPFLLVYTWVKADTMAWFFWRFPRHSSPQNSDLQPSKREFVSMSRNAPVSDDEYEDLQLTPERNEDIMRPLSRHPPDEPWMI